jgi:hypothetical protein
MYDFHPVTLALPIGAWVLLEVHRGERGRPWLPLLAMPLIREDVALLYGVVVLIAGIRRKQRTWRVTGLSVALVGVIYLFFMRAQPGIGNHVWYRYQFDTVGEFLSRLLRADVFIAFAGVLGPLLLVPVFKGWRKSWPGLLLLASFAFSSRPTSLYYQYYAQAVPFLIAGALGPMLLPDWSRRIRLSVMATISIAVLLGPFFYIGFGPPDRYATVILSSSQRGEARALVSNIPATASVSATEMLTPALAWRRDIHPFPGPMVCGNSLLYFIPTTRAVEYVLLEARDTPPGVEWSSTLLAWGFALEGQKDGIELWRLHSDRVPRQECPSWERQLEGALDD